MSGQSTFYSQVYQAYLKAARHKPIARHISLANQQIALQFANQLLVDQFFPAFNHLKSTHYGTPDLTICVFDSGSSDIALPAPASSQAVQHMKNRERWGYNLRGDSQDPVRILYLPSPHERLNMLHSEHDTAIYWVPDGSKVAFSERGRPMRFLFELWFENIGMHLTHAAAVGTSNGAALIVGRGRQGKSTSALACLLHDAMYYLGDDYILLGTDPDPTVYSLFGSGTLDAEHLQQNLPKLKPMVVNGDKFPEEEALVMVREGHAKRMARKLPVRVALLPRVSNRAETTVTPTSPSRLLIGLASSTIFQSASSGRETFEALTRTITGLPCYVLDVGTDLSTIPTTIESVIANHSHD